MNKQIITFDANEQSLIKTGGVDKYSSNKVSYIEAHFNLGENWSGYDSVRAVWSTWYECISTVLDTEGICIVPYEVLKRTEKVMVNLVGSISEDDVLTDRLTSYPIVALTVDADAKACGSNTQPITPSEFEQYVAIVRSLVETVKDIDHISLNSDYTLTIYYSDGTSDTTGSVRGADGNGIESVTKTGASGLVDTYTITFTDGQTTTFTVTNGARGDTGNGIASIEKTSTVGLVDTYTITFTDGNTTTFTVTNGEKGDKGDTGEVSQAEFDAAITDVKSELHHITGVEEIPITYENKSCDTSGSSITLSDGYPALVSTGSYDCRICECVEGDTFTVTGYGGTTSRLWAFVSSTGSVLAKADGSANKTNLVIVAPASSHWLIVNTKRANASSLFRGESLPIQIENVVQDSQNVVRKDLKWMYGSVSKNTGKDETTNTNKYIKSDYLQDVIKIEVLYKLRVLYYTEQFQYISYTETSTNNSVWDSSSLPSNAKYVRIVVIYSSGMDIGNINNIAKVTQKRDALYHEVSVLEKNNLSATMYPYEGERISLIPQMTKDLVLSGGIGQDGAIIQNKLFAFNSDGTFAVYDMQTTRQIATGCVMGLPSENVAPHCNSACIGEEVNSEGFPYIYVNAYNAEGLPQGACYVYSIHYANDTYSAELVQTILIGFTDSPIWNDGTSSRPYGNFAVYDGHLYVVTLPSSNKTRVFKFALPEVSSGTVTFALDDIVDQFDLSWMPFIQGTTICNGKIYQLSGFGSASQGGAYPAYCYVVDLDRKKIVSTIPLDNVNITAEPELVDVYDNMLLIGINGSVFGLKF